MQKRGARETAARVRQHVAAIFRFAAAHVHPDSNPADAPIEVLTKAQRVRRRPAITSLPELGALLRHPDLAPQTPSVRQCHRLIAHTATRIANATAARWDEMQLEAEPAVWVIPRDQLKVRGRDLPNKVMLSSQVINELHRLRAVVGDEEYIFPGTQGRDYVVREAIEKGLCVTLRLADRHSPHGWRSSFSTIAKESGEFKNEVVDLALDHIHDSAVARAYDRRERLAQRVRLAQWWSDHLASAERTSK